MKTVMGTDMTMVSLKTADRLRTLERARDRLAEQVDVCRVPAIWRCWWPGCSR